MLLKAVARHETRCNRCLLLLCLWSFVAASPLKAETTTDAMRRVRRHLHENPELSGREHETQAYLKTELEQAGFHHVEPIAGTGLRVIHDTRRPGPTLAFRAELDALPVTEETGLPCRSQNAGVMHACGHDLHAAVLYGLAREVRANTNLAGRFVFLFQPAEEGVDRTETAGAARMIAEGALEAPTPNALFALHAVDFLNVGEVGYKSGTLMAQSADFTITFTGEGGHPASIHMDHNPIVAASAFITAARDIVGDPNPVTAPAVIGFGQIEAGTRRNVIPRIAVIKGTTRSRDPVLAKRLPVLIEEALQHTSSSRGCRYAFDYKERCPPLLNDPALTDAAVRLLREQHVELVPVQPLLASEDFARYAQHIPCAYFLIGASKPERYSGTLHSPQYNPAEDAIDAGLRLLNTLATQLRLPGEEPR